MSLRNRLERLERRPVTTATGFGGSPGFWRAVAGADGGATPDELAAFRKMVDDLGPFQDTLAARIEAVRNPQQQEAE
jgi:hypothetical protein